jgi:integrase
MLDGPNGYNPVSKVKPPSKPRAIPRAIDFGYTTFNQMEPSATKAFLMIMASCGFRPIEIKRTEPWMLHLGDAEQPRVIRNTAKGGEVVVVPLSEVGILAWRMWLTCNPWDAEKGGWTMPSMSNVNRDWKEAMKRAGFVPTRCYNLVHSYCTRLLTAGGADISLVSKARGHRDIRTTMVYTQVVIDPRLASAVNQAIRHNAK